MIETILFVLLYFKNVNLLTIFCGCIIEVFLSELMATKNTFKIGCN